MEQACFSERKQAIFRSNMVAAQSCQTHGDLCEVPFVDLDVSGLPCTDHSRMNGKRKFLEGPTSPLIAVWALRLKRHSIPVAILENTPAPRLNAI